MHWSDVLGVAGIIGATLAYTGMVVYALRITGER